MTQLAKNRNAAAWILAVGLAWLWTWWRLSFEWRANSQYQYAYAVPFLAAYLAMLSFRRVRGEEGCCVENPAFSYLGILLAWGFFTLGELLWQQDPSWRLSLGCFMFGTTLWSVICLARSGGWALLRGFLFPLAFTWLALPWPGPLESWVVSSLLRFLTGITTDILNTVGIPALQRGAVIELRNGLVGMETACSGVQSFQASLMASLFLGPVFCLSRSRRFALVLLAITIALAGNLVRILILTCLMHRLGPGAMERFHDLAGAAVTIATFAGIYGVARLISAGRPEEGVEPHHPPLPPRRGADGIVSLGLLASTPFLVWGWFKAFGAEPLQKNPQWELRAPPSEQWQTQRLELSAAERAILKFSRGEAIQARNGLGFNAYVYHFFWAPKARVSSAAFAHTPNICLPSLGWTQVGPPVARRFAVGEVPLEAVVYRFTQSGTEQRAAQVILPQPFFKAGYPVLDRMAHLSLLWRAPRQRVQEVLLVYCSQSAGLAIPDQIMEQLFQDFFRPAAP